MKIQYICFNIVLANVEMVLEINTKAAPAYDSLG